MNLTTPEVTRDVTLGTIQLLDQLAIACITELTLSNNRRCDVMGLTEKGDIWIVEVKSCQSDYESDQKWHEYRPFCDKFFFAVSEDFPKDLIPKDTGLIIADRYGGAIIRPAIEDKLPGARRKALTLKFARQAARRSSQTNILDI